MRKITIFLSVLVLTAMLLTACGGQQRNEESNEANNTKVPATVEATSTGKATTTETVSPGKGTTTPGIPVTGEENPARFSRELDFEVLDKDGNKLGEVSDMVLDFDNSKVAYVVVGAGGFLGIGEKKILVPWNLLKLQADANGKNAFVLQTKADTLKNAPDFDLNNLPQIGQSTADWDAQIHKYWQSGGVTTANTPIAKATVTPNATATAGTGNGTGAGVVALKGVMLASKVLGAAVVAGTPAGATASSGTGTGTATATPGANAATANTVSATIKDMIMDTAAGKALFAVVDAKFDDGEHWIPIPLKKLQWDTAAQTFVLKTDAATLQKAPFFQEDQFPNPTTSGWDNEFVKFWGSK